MALPSFIVVGNGQKLPNALQGFFEDRPPEYYEAMHFDPATGFHLDFFKTSSGPGQAREDQGFTVRAKSAVTAGTIVILSKPGVFLDKKKYPNINGAKTVSKSI
jgi:hypothetical protein